MKQIDLRSTKLPFQKASYQDLFEVMSNKGKDPQSAIEAFNEFYYRFGNKIWNLCKIICFKYSNSQQYCEDVYQDTIISIFNNSDKFDPKFRKNNIEMGLKAWIGKIANNHLIDKLRKYHDKSHPIVSLDDEDEDVQLEGEVDINYNEKPLSLNQMKLEYAA